MKTSTELTGNEAAHEDKASVSNDVLRILEEHRNDRGGLISILEEIQAEYGYLPEEALRLVSAQTGRSLVDIYGVATFYRFFSLHPKGKHLICTCLGTACHVRGASRILTELEHQLGISAGQTTPDNEFTLETVNCLGACALGPVVVIDGHYYSKVRKSGVKQLLDEARKGFDHSDIGNDERIFPIEAYCPHCGQSFRDEAFAVDGVPSLAIHAAADGVQALVRLSSLYGSYTVATDIAIPEGTVVNFSCPHCKTVIDGTSDCSECHAPIIALPVTGGGTVQLCSRRGCRSHRLDLT